MDKYLSQNEGVRFCRLSSGGNVVGAFKSEGGRYKTKSLVSLTTNQVDVQYDDFSLEAGAPLPAKR